LLALRCAPPVFAPAEAERIASTIYGLAVAAEGLPGERDCNFLIRTADAKCFVLKIIDGAADPQAVDCQIKVLEHLAEQDPGLPVPRRVATLDGADLGSIVQGDLGPFLVCLVDYLPGRVLADMIPGRGLLENVGATLARLDRALRGFFHPALAQHIAWDVRRLPELVQYAPLIEAPDVRSRVLDVVQAVQRSLPAWRSLRSQALHADCHGGNLLVDGGSAGEASSVCGILDFGDMIHAPLVLEPAVAMSELLTESLTVSGELPALLAGYARVTPLDASEVGALYDLVTGRHAVTLLLHAWRRRHDPPGARLVERAAANAAASLESLEARGRGALLSEWALAAGLGSAALGAEPGAGGEPKPSAPAPGPESVDASTPAIDLERRHRLLGAGAELFYENPLHLVRGEGVWLYDARGSAYLDVYNNVPHVGHCHPRVVAAIQRQTARLATHTRYLHEAILDYAERLTARCPPHLDACLFVNSGSEANDVAWRMARFATGRRGALVMAHAYHGITDAVADLTPGAGQPADPRVMTLALPAPSLQAIGGMAGGSAEALAAAAQDVDAAVRTLTAREHAPAAFFIDSALTSSGILDPPASWMEVVAGRVRAAGALIVADEVQNGLGRSGSHFWGFERRGLTCPDIITLGKPVGNGYPMGVVIASRALIEAFQAKFGFFSTFGGNPVAAAAGRAVLDVLEEEGLCTNADATGAYLRRRLAEVAGRHPSLGAVRGAGLLVGLEVRGRDAGDSRRRTQWLVNVLAAEHRVLTGAEGPLGNIVKLRPPMPFRPEHADRLADAIDAAAVGLSRRSTARVPG
jgi:4-aminobutyrate aminotransferase-like enzyme/Ser/Thr protein kinase RdoA (MazF antagonist)